MNKKALIVILIAFAALGTTVGGVAYIQSQRQSTAIPDNQTQFSQNASSPTPGALQTGTSSNSAMQIRSFKINFPTPTFVLPNNQTTGQAFYITDGSTSDAATYQKEQQDFITNHNFVQSAVTIDNTPGVKLAGTMPYADLQDMRVAGPAQWSVFYITHGDKITKFLYEYLGSTPDPAREAVLTAMIQAAKLH